jgi:hypothetical protein
MSLGVGVTELVRPTYLLDQLAANGAYEHGLHLKNPNISYDEMAALGRMLGRFRDDLNLAIGDWLIQVEIRFPEKFSQAVEELKMNPGLAMDYMRISRQVPQSVRIKNPRHVTHSTYRTVAAFKVVDEKTGEVVTDHARQREVLELVERDDISHHQLRDMLRPEPVEPERCPTCGQRVAS